MAEKNVKKDYNLWEVVKVSETKNGQYRITLKKKIAQALNIKGGDYLVFLMDKDGQMIVKKLVLKDVKL